MNQDKIIESLGSHLDSLKQTIGWALLLSVVFAWAGLTNANPVKALGLEITRSSAFYVAAIFYVFVNSKVLDLLLRIGDLIKLLDDEHLIEGITKVVVHPFIVNPFSYFGDDFLSKAHSAKGYGAIIIVWWIANSSLFTLADEQTIVTLGLMGVFLLVGLASMNAINRVYRLILKQLAKVDRDLHQALNSGTFARRVVSLISIVIGALIAQAVIHSGTLWNS